MIYPNLFSPMNIGSVRIKNRVIMSSMCVGLAKHDGAASKELADYYEERAKAGVGLIMTECTRVNETDCVSHASMMSLSSDRYIKPLRETVDRVHAHGAKIFVQLFHPGRQNVGVFPTLWQFNERAARVFPPYWNLYFKATSGIDESAMDDPKMVKRMERYMKPLLAPSDVPCGLGVNAIRNQKTVAMTAAQIKKLVVQFVDAALRAKKAGADGVELHAAHGYLFQQFLSPYTNRRTDVYGGSLENRMRFIQEVIHGIRQMCGIDFPISVRLTADEFYDTIGYPNQGIVLEEGIEIAKRLEAFGIDAINVSSGGYDTDHTCCEPISYEPGWRKHLAQAIKEVVNIPVIAANLIRSPEQAEMQIEEGIQDFVSMGRPFLADPEWVDKAKNGKGEDILKCICCLHCMEYLHKSVLNGKPIECAINPRTCKEDRYEQKNIQNGRRRRVVVVGAGPAGLTAARELAARNFDVKVLEKNKEPGGQLIYAKAPPKKEKIDWLIKGLTNAAIKEGASIIYNVKATKSVIDSYSPYAVVFATGGEAFMPKIPGADLKSVTTVTPILSGEKKYTNKKIVVVGSGMTGLETAELLIEQGNSVTIVEMMDKLAPGGYLTNVTDVVQRLEAANTRFLLGRRLERIEDGMLHLRRENGVFESVEADAAILAIGVRSKKEMTQECKGHYERMFVIGDAEKPGRIGNATAKAFEMARTLQ